MNGPTPAQRAEQEYTESLVKWEFPVTGDDMGIKYPGRSGLYGAYVRCIYPQDWPSEIRPGMAVVCRFRGEEQMVLRRVKERGGKLWLVTESHNPDAPKPRLFGVTVDVWGVVASYYSVLELPPDEKDADAVTGAAS